MKYLWKLRPYFRQTAGELVLGSLAGIVMNTAVVLPAILLGAAIDKALALERGAATPDDVTLAALLLVGGTLLTEGPRVLKRWWLMTANARIRANLRADALRGALSRPLADLHKTSIGDQMARIVGDVEVLGVGVREFTIETWDTVLFSLLVRRRDVRHRRAADAPRAGAGADCDADRSRVRAAGWRRERRGRGRRTPR